MLLLTFSRKDLFLYLISDRFSNQAEEFFSLEGELILKKIPPKKYFRMIPNNKYYMWTTGKFYNLNPFHQGLLGGHVNSDEDHTPPQPKNKEDNRELFS